MEQSINIMINSITNILYDNKPSIFLYGSIVLDDFKLGWSDIDIICLTDKKIETQQADKLLNLRQTLLFEYPDNQYFRLFEGGMLTLNSFINNIEDIVVYWGTSGQRITNSYGLCPFSKIELLENGRKLCGDDFRHLIKYPSNQEIIEAVRNHYESIKKHPYTPKSIRSTGFILDIARCLYTLKTMKVISKTKAGEWVLEHNLFPDRNVLERVIEIRQNPIKYSNDENTLKWIPSLEPYMQKFADVLGEELNEI